MLSELDCIESYLSCLTESITCSLYKLAGSGRPRPMAADDSPVITGAQYEQAWYEQTRYEQTKNRNGIRVENERQFDGITVFLCHANSF